MFALAILCFRVNRFSINCSTICGSFVGVLVMVLLSWEIFLRIMCPVCKCRRRKNPFVFLVLHQEWSSCCVRKKKRTVSFRCAIVVARFIILTLAASFGNVGRFWNLSSTFWCRTFLRLQRSMFSFCLFRPWFRGRRTTVSGSRRGLLSWSSCLHWTIPYPLHLMLVVSISCFCPPHVYLKHSNYSTTRSSPIDFWKQPQ